MLVDECAIAEYQQGGRSGNSIAACGNRIEVGAQLAKDDLSPEIAGHLVYSGIHLLAGPAAQLPAIHHQRRIDLQCTFKALVK